MRLCRVAVVFVLGALLLCGTAEQAAAQSQSCGREACAAADEGGEVGVNAGASDGDDCSGPFGCDICLIFPNSAGCQASGGDSGGRLPLCVTEPLTGDYVNEPCVPAAQPCIGFGTNCDPAALPPPPIPPPTLGEAEQAAVAQVVWPTIDAGPDVSWRSFNGKPLPKIMAGFEHSLELQGYDWSTLSATASITNSVTANGQVYSETFTATVTAVPTEVRWDTGPNNNVVTQHNPPTTVTCDNPGVSRWSGTGKFQDWWSYNGYGGPNCAFVWWGITSKVGAPTTITAEMVWDLSLTTSWAGDVGPVGQHTETYSTPGYEVAAFGTATVIRGAEDVVTRLEDN